jgi:hypothetical protein
MKAPWTGWTKSACALQENSPDNNKQNNRHRKSFKKGFQYCAHTYILRLMPAKTYYLRNLVSHAHKRPEAPDFPRYFKHIYSGQPHAPVPVVFLS